MALVVHAFVLVALASSAFSQLSTDYYDDSCPNALSTINGVVEAAVRTEFRTGASLLRLHFLDCFVNGCDGSILLDSTPSIDSEKNAKPVQSARGFDVVDKIKEAVDQACGQSVVSCADILAVAARDSVVALGGPTWEVKLGRRDSSIASREAAEANIPEPNSNLTELISSFKKHGLDEKDLVVLSGAHSIGFARCASFRNHIYDDSNIDPNFAKSQLKSICPRNGGDLNLARLDPTPANFDNTFYSNLVQKKGLLHSDQVLFNGGSTDKLVKQYNDDAVAFYQDFVDSMIKMGNIQPLTGNQGEIRVNCRKVN